MLPSALKMVIWDLDDTFWQGTLSEGDIAIPQRNIDLVIALAGRGIVSSICSKNAYDAVRRVLLDRDLWSYFVFPSIEFSAKGGRIAGLIEAVNLRPANVLFVDDNRLNLAEAALAAPGLMTAHPADILSVLLDLPQAAGKPDPEMTRLRQYRLLEEKSEDRARSTGSNEAFLRQCDVRVRIDFDVQPHLERIIELINRSNQLNFTKKRVETGEQRAAFDTALNRYGTHAGIVSVSDRYGDYGIVGFYLVRRLEGGGGLEHFVFSCRIMNMGIEQYVYELLAEPRCPVVYPVANPIRSFTKVDWIRPMDESGVPVSDVSDARLLLIGGCDLLQVATYCSANRSEYVNVKRNGVNIRYDDGGFLLSPRDALAASSILASIPCWTAAEAVRFDADLAEADAVIASLWEVISGRYMLVEDTILVRLIAQSPVLDRYVDKASDLYDARCETLALDRDQKLDLVSRACDRLAALSPKARVRFLLGVNTRNLALATGAEARIAFNAFAAGYCARHGTFEFVSVDDVVPEGTLIGGTTHFTRQGYFALAAHMKARMAALGL